jgi:hypothetical protein
MAFGESWSSFVRGMKQARLGELLSARLASRCLRNQRIYPSLALDFDLPPLQRRIRAETSSREPRKLIKGEIFDDRDLGSLCKKKVLVSFR